MNMLPAMKENAYQDHTQAVHDAAERTVKDDKRTDNLQVYYGMPKSKYHLASFKINR